MRGLGSSPISAAELSRQGKPIRASHVNLRIALWSGLAMVAFASNSILCRLALRSQAIDPASFTSIRLVAGAGMLLLLIALKGTPVRPRLSVFGLNAAMLFLYAIAFSYAYVELGAGTGALILFGAVQATMMVTAIATGERPGWTVWAGLVVAMSGLVYLVWPGLAAPSPWGTMLMTASGMAWGIYSLRGRRSHSPLAATAASFLLSVPAALLVSLLARSHTQLTSVGVVLAVCSGAVTSGLGYVAWYAALRGLTSTRAAIIQLTVPVIAGFGGVIFLSEAIGFRLCAAAILILGGVALASKKQAMPKSLESA